MHASHSHSVNCVRSDELSRLKLLSLDELKPTAGSIDRHDSDNNDEETIGKRDLCIQQCGFDDDNPFLEDKFGNLTNWRLSDLEREFMKHLKTESSIPKIEEKKLSKEEKLKLHNDCVDQYMKCALMKYNEEENLQEDSGFKFVKAIKESSIIEGGTMLYQHFNFTAMQTNTVSLFFAEVIPNEETCEVKCCSLLHDDENGKCFGCKNQGDPDLRHPSCEGVYVGGHEDCICPFLLDTDSDEDDSD